jgi:phytoene synthase
MSAGLSPLEQFTRTSHAVAAQVLRKYSTSFGLATNLLGSRHREHIRNIYALVRVADEIVDGVAAEAGLDASDQRSMLEGYIQRTHEAMRTGYSCDLVIHAFAQTAREAGIEESLTGPFFDSMLTDLDPVPMDEQAHRHYVHGSAEVVGLMCLRVFLRAESMSPTKADEVEYGARRLGAAFQNINFLRDLAEDTGELGRSYLHPAADARLTHQAKQQWTQQIRAELDDAVVVIPMLPRDARTAVRAALMLFEGLLSRIEQSSVEELYRRRTRVPDATKALLAARALGTTWRERI